MRVPIPLSLTPLGWSLIIHFDFSPDKKEFQHLESHPSNLKRFLSYARPYRWWLVLSTVVGVTKYNLPVIFPWILKNVIDHLLSGKPSITGLSFDQLIGLAVFDLGDILYIIPVDKNVTEVQNLSEFASARFLPF